MNKPLEIDRIYYDKDHPSFDSGFYIIKEEGPGMYGDTGVLAYPINFAGQVAQYHRKWFRKDHAFTGEYFKDTGYTIADLDRLGEMIRLGMVVERID